MRKHLILIIVVLISCGDSGKVRSVFNEMKEAACEQDFSRYEKSIDYNVLADNVVSAPLQNDEDRKSVISRVKEIQKNVIKTKKKNPYCDAEIQNIFVDGEVARVEVVSEKYFTHILQFHKKSGSWKFISYGESQGPANKTTVEFLEEFDANGIVANEKYKDKIIKLIGPVEKIDKDKDGKTYILFKGDVLNGVLCYIDTDHIQDVGIVSAGQNVAITGKYGGKKQLDFGTVGIELLYLKDCVFSVYK